MRKLILHYHLFKNAGSSIDEMLKQSFGKAWLNFDKPLASSKILPSEMSDFIAKNPQARAISSHQVMPPLPQGDYEVFPIVFLRHPLDRARSAYLFEWKKQLGLSEPKGSFSDYVLEKLVVGNRGPITNFQTYQLSNKAYGGQKAEHDLGSAEKLARAKSFIAELPYFGLVEAFHESLIRMQFYLKYHFPDLKVVNRQVNATQGVEQNLEEKLLNIRRELGDALYGELAERNYEDLQLYKFACEEFLSAVPCEN